MGPSADAAGAIVAAPDGLLDAAASRYWNGPSACCDYFDPNPDDVDFLGDLIDEIADRIAVDPRALAVC